MDLLSKNLISGVAYRYEKSLGDKIHDLEFELENLERQESESGSIATNLHLDRASMVYFLTQKNMRGERMAEIYEELEKLRPTPSAPPSPPEPKPAPKPVSAEDAFKAKRLADLSKGVKIVTDWAKQPEVADDLIQYMMDNDSDLAQVAEDIYKEKHIQFLTQKVAKDLGYTPEETKRLEEEIEQEIVDAMPWYKS